MSETPLWLSHHRPEHYHRCVRVGGVRVCARCLGLYPVLFLGLGAQIAARASMRHPADGWIAFGLAVPALVDWARGRLNPESGTNLSRVATGALLGVALARSIYLHLRSPFNPLSGGQFAFLAGVFLLVEGLAWLRRRRSDPNGGSDV